MTRPYKIFRNAYTDLTTTGYIGLTPLDTQPGNKICISFGGRVPFIYVHGLMEGEVLEMIEKEEVRVQNFYLV
jgi:hypothetical protein